MPVSLRLSDVWKIAIKMNKQMTCEKLQEPINYLEIFPLNPYILCMML